MEDSQEWSGCAWVSMLRCRHLPYMLTIIFQIWSRRAQEPGSALHGPSTIL